MPGPSHFERKGVAVASPRARRLERARRWAWAVVDAEAWFAAIVGGVWLRYDFDGTRALADDVLLTAVVVAVTHVAVGALIGPYAVGHERGSYAEVWDIAKTVFVTGLALTLVVLLTQLGPLPRSVPFSAAAFALIGMFALRFMIRSWTTRVAAHAGEERRAIVFGAGEAGRRLTRSLIYDKDSDLKPVALLDDDKTKGRLRVEGIRVRGTRDHIATVAAKQDATTLIVALPQAEAATIRELTDRAAEVGLEVLVLPPVSELIGGRPTAQDLRDVDLKDLLGRHPITLDTSVIADHLSGRRVLVTGAGGSIGSELCRQITRFGPAKLFMLDRDESGLQAAHMSLTGHGLLDSDELVLADIRDLDSVRQVFQSAQPDIVFHAAALKHLPLLEAYPLEAWKSNVLGTLNVLTASSEAGVDTFVNISTDKAANASSVLGYSKRVAERLTAAFATTCPGRYVSVRFGNVLGSRGSVVHAFTAQIQRGGPVTVTHPDVERYFMLIPEACQLVLEAAAIGSDGDVMVLNMGEQVKIVEVAKTLLRMSARRDVEITYTGLRPGEKMGEELFASDEDCQATAHELVWRVEVPPLGTETVKRFIARDADLARQWMRAEGGVSEQLADGTAEEATGGRPVRGETISLARTEPA
jgi:FlaA1/EpsC-like NDP-sugar epimerase